MLIPRDSMTPAKEEGWRVLLDLYKAFPKGWCIIGGQMVWLLAHEYDVRPMRATDDVDIVVDIRADKGLIRRLCGWLESHGFELERIGTDSLSKSNMAIAAGMSCVLR
jgi:hypothetical protein